MELPTKNPFNITKAVDFDDKQINNYWVEIPSGEGSFREMFKPTSPMPVIILGGKGSGKTHLMRYFSYPLQKIRHSDDIVGGIKKDGYLGVYFRCTGLNTERFSGKSQSNEIWASVFSYYMELWFAQQLLRTIRDLFQKNTELEAKVTFPRLLYHYTLEYPALTNPASTGMPVDFFSVSCLINSSGVRYPSELWGLAVL